MGTTLFATEEPIIQVPDVVQDQTTGELEQIAIDNAALNAGKHQHAGAQFGAMDIHRYPQELGTDPQIPSYVMFYVNAREEGAMATQRGFTGDAAKYDQTKENRGSPDHAALEGSLAVGTAIGLGAAKNAAKQLSDELTGKAPLSSRIVTSVVGGTLGAVVGGAAGAAFGGIYGHYTKRALVRVKDVVALHINNPPSVAYKANWSETDMGFVGAAGSGRLNDANAGDIAKGTGDLLARAMASGIPKVAGSASVRDTMEAVSRKVQNPYKEQLFKSMGMRTFSFEYNFHPKSPQEAQNVLSILRIFKRNMHPEMDASKLFLVYPSEFNIVYYYKDRENAYLNKISSCVLTDMAVRYGDEKDFTTFKTGFPTLVNMRLSFLELEMLTGERVDDDFNYTGTTYGF